MTRLLLHVGKYKVIIINQYQTLNSILKYTVKFLNFRTPENFDVIYLKFKKSGQTSGHLVKKMQME